MSANSINVTNTADAWLFESEVLAAHPGHSLVYLRDGATRSGLPRFAAYRYDPKVRNLDASRRPIAVAVHTAVEMKSRAGKAYYKLAADSVSPAEYDAAKAARAGRTTVAAPRRVADNAEAHAAMVDALFADA